jgi:hypothetical protein
MDSFGGSFGGGSFGGGYGSPDAGLFSGDTYGTGTSGPRSEREHGQRSTRDASRRDSWAGPFAGKGPKGYRRSDERLIEEASEALERNGQLDASEIEVTCKEGILTLRGTVDSRRGKRLAEETAEDVYGVRDVMNELKVESDSRSKADGQYERSSVSKSDSSRHDSTLAGQGTGSSSSTPKR